MVQPEGHEERAAAQRAWAVEVQQAVLELDGTVAEYGALQEELTEIIQRARRPDGGFDEAAVVDALRAMQARIEWVRVRCESLRVHLENLRVR